MKRLFSMLVLVGVTFAAHPPIIRAADVYANSVVAVSYNVLTPTNALGAPDGMYADFRAASTYLTLDLGAGEEGLGGVTITYSLLNYGAVARITFLAENNDVLAVGGSPVLPNDQHEYSFTYNGDIPFRFVKIESPEAEQWRLDAVAVTALATPEPAPEPEPEPEPAPEAPANLIMSPIDSAVYYLDDSGVRHAFPNELTFNSWELGTFGDVETLSLEELASYPLGDTVTVRPGSYLVKLQTVPKVYAVAPGGELRWIVDEATAVELYGTAWANLVIDVSDAFWPDYTVGENIDEQSDIEGWEIPGMPF